jgi:hypothetical protein
MLFFLHVFIRALKIADIDCYKIKGAFGSTDTFTSIFIIVDMTKTSSNNCLLLYINIYIVFACFFIGLQLTMEIKILTFK